MRPHVACLAALLLAGPVGAAVQQAAADHFTVVHSGWVGRTPAAVWAALVDWPGWWPDAHTYSGKAANLDLDAEADGELEEQWGEGNSVLHGTVLQAQPGRLLRLNAPLGPLQAMPVVAILDIALAAEADGTRVTLTHRVAGPAHLQLDQLAPAVDAVHAEAFQRLLAHTPAAPTAQPKAGK